jgi:hypothetical protein
LLSLGVSVKMNVSTPCLDQAAFSHVGVLT